VKEADWDVLKHEFNTFYPDCYSEDIDEPLAQDTAWLPINRLEREEAGMHFITAYHALGGPL
jgi:hypothetical protein